VHMAVMNRVLRVLINNHWVQRGDLEVTALHKCHIINFERAASIMLVCVECACMLCSFHAFLGNQHMMTFKEFLLSRDHEIHNHERATMLYNDYKLEFRRGALAEFFQQHSEEEWFLER
jgi:hypothetical protein